jgi:CheY-like chemotaxis protein
MTAVRILHVDDELDIRDVVKISLSLDPEFETRSCASGAEALAVAEEWPPDVIVLDVMMPGMDGPATLARLRESKQTVNIPVVFMTARAQSTEIAYFRSLGAAGVISKPFDPMTLAASVRGYVSPAIARLDVLRAVFLKRVADDSAALASHRCALDSGKAVAASLASIERIAHGLAGAGGIFGFTAISDAASDLEIAIKLNGPGSPEEIAKALDGLLTSLEMRRTDNPHFLLGA